MRSYPTVIQVYDDDAFNTVFNPVKSRVSKTKTNTNEILQLIDKWEEYSLRVKNI